MADLAKEKRIIDRINSIYNKQRGDFGSNEEWNDYLEMKEELIFNLVEQQDVAETEKRIREYQRQNQTDILMRQAAQMQEAQEAAGQGPSGVPPPDYNATLLAMQQQAGAPGYFDVDMEEPGTGPGARPQAPAPVSMPLSRTEMRQLRRSVGRNLRVVVSANAAPAPGAKPWKPKNCRIVFQDGSEFVGNNFGATGTVVGEVCFNTSITGYQEILTDPSYYKQFVCFTHPHIGNTGINFEDAESSKCWMKGAIVKDLPATVSNYRSRKTLGDYFKEQGVVGISDVDTRKLTKIVRNYGCLNAVITTDMSKSKEELVAMAQAFNINGVDCIKDVTTDKVYEWTGTTDSEWEFAPNTKQMRTEEPVHIVAYDFGIKRNILRRLGSYGARVTVVPASTPAEKVLELNPDGIFFSNGPGDPSAVPYAVENAKKLLGKKPTFGICMGHQIMGQAFGAKTFKLPFGHHGGNHPIKHLPTGRIEISAQNHNFAIDPETLPKHVEVTHINLNDGTCAGLVAKDLQAMTIQYHPEAGPGPHDSDISFEDFVKMVRESKKVAA